MRFDDELEIERAMVIFAHPDDAEFGTAGTAAVWARQGVEVTYVLVTNGASGSSDPDMTRERLTEIRYAEQQEACDILGVEHLMKLGFEDGYVYPDLDLRKAVSREIRRHKPDVVISMDPRMRVAFERYINHPDHIAVGEVVMRAINPDASSGLMFPELWRTEGFEPHLPKALFLMSFAEGEVHVDITDVIDLKVKALACHRSQMDDTDGSRDFVYDRAREAGKRFGCEYAEAYTLIRTG